MVIFSGMPGSLAFFQLKACTSGCVAVDLCGSNAFPVLESTYLCPFEVVCIIIKIHCIV